MNGQEILITGGTGSLGTALTKLIKSKYKPKGIRIFSRSELMHFNMLQKLQGWGMADNVSFIIGDVRNYRSLEMACRGVDTVINAAAMKRIETCDANPIECVNTNVNGVQNLVHAAVSHGVKRVLHISTDKAVYPTTLYGSSKKCAEDIIKYANTYSGGRHPVFSCVRYGNVFGSNGSVVQIFRKQAKETGVLTITDQQMTRFWITLEKVADFILSCLTMMAGGEIFIPKMPSATITWLARTICPEAELKFIGIRGQEKIHECLLTHEESRYTIELNDRYCVVDKAQKKTGTFSYMSNTNEWQLTRDELRKMTEEL